MHGQQNVKILILFLFLIFWIAEFTRPNTQYTSVFYFYFPNHFDFFFDAHNFWVWLCPRYHYTSLLLAAEVRM